MSRTTIEPSSVDGAPSTETLRLQNQVFPDVHGHNPAASQNSDAKEDDESPLAYALRHGLGTDHPHHNPYASMRELKRSFCETHRAFKHPSRTPSPHKEFELKERLVVNTEVAQFLREIMVTPELPEQFDQEPSDSRPKPKRDDLKTEPPLLRSDSELDTPHRGRPPGPDLKKLSTTIPLIPEREEDDENLEYEAGVLDKIRRRGKAVETEKLEVPGEACRFLRTVLREHCDSADEEEFVASEIHRPRFEEVAHPLRPGVLSPIPFEPPPAGHVGLVSTESCPQDLRLSNAQLAKHDTLNKSLSDVVPPVNTELGLAHDDGHESETAEWSHAVRYLQTRFVLANQSSGRAYPFHPPQRMTVKETKSRVWQRRVLQAIDGTLHTSIQFWMECFRSPRRWPYLCKAREYRLPSSLTIFQRIRLVDLIQCSPRMLSIARTHLEICANQISNNE